MSKLKITQIALFASLAAGTMLFTPNSYADWGHPEQAYRYRISYQQWDRGFSTYYQYQETCSRSYGWYGVYQTCYDTQFFSPSSYVYIEEYQMSGGYHRVRVFRDYSHHDLYATYYVYDSGPIHRVEYREFHYNDPFFTHPYQSDEYIENHVMWESFDWTHGFAETVIGATSVGIGTAVMAASGGDPALLILGGASMALGSLSVSDGMHEMHRSKLHSHIVRTHYDSGLDVR